MPNYHQTTIIGHLGKDPETRYMSNGDAVCNFSVAVTESWKDQSGDKKEQTTWYRVNAFKKLAEICGQYLKKGAPVMIVGKMQERKWQDKDGQERTSWELRAETMQMLGGKSDSEESPPKQSPKKQSNASGGFNDLDSDIPFAPISKKEAMSC